MRAGQSSLTLVLVALVGCGSPDDADDESAPRTFVGPIDGTEAFVGVVLDDEAFFAYVCDGTPDATTISSWFVGDVHGAMLDASKPSGSSLAAELGDDTLAGTYTSASGDASSFTADVAAAPSGLYFGERGEGTEEIWGGWIVIGAAQRGAVVDRNTGDIVGSPSIDPNAPDVDVDGEPLAYDGVEEPIGEAVDDVPPG